MKPTLEPGEFLKAVPIAKVDEAKQQAWGIFTAEVPDSDDEIADYEYQKGRVKLWSDDAKDKAAAAGQEESLGNVRFAHSTLPTGKVIAINMDDAKKEIGGGTYITNVGETKSWDMVAKGILQGFSFGGRYDWRKCNDCGRDLPLVQGDNYCDTCKSPVQVRYGATIAELSVCDRPAVPVANIMHIKADGSAVPVPAEAAMDKADKTKRVAGEDLKPEAFAYVGDEEKTASWKFPLHFSTEEKSARHVRNALARFSQAKGIPADKKAEVKAKIIAAAKKYGVEVSEEEEKSATSGLDKSFFKAAIQHIKKTGEVEVSDKGITLRKDLYDVANFAEVLQRIAWLRYSAIQERDYEGDESEIPEELEENLISLSETFLAMAEEETRELVSAAKKAGKVTMEKENTVIEPGVAATLVGHVVDMQADHEQAAEEHKSMAAEHEARGVQKKAVHDHFKKAAEEGGDLADHHAMHADDAKIDMEHHAKAAEYHKAMAAKCDGMAAKCGKMADTFADTPEKTAKVAELRKAAREARPKVSKSAAAPIAIDTANMSTSEKAAFDSVNATWLNSEEYKKMTMDMFRAQTMAKLNAAANGAAVVVGVDGGNDNIYAVPRPGQINKSADFTEGISSIDMFDLPVLQ